MNQLYEFDLLNIPLSGVNLLEASAGTGKTYNIEGLFLRFVIENGLSVGEILVATYTVAATEELRERIRKRLRDAADAFSLGKSGDSLLQALLKKFPNLRDRLMLQERLKAALRDYDEASIFTIHGFCQRMLQENAFESRSLFDTELITDERAIREEIAEDFWRIHLYENIPELSGYAVARGFNPGYFRKLLDDVLPFYDVRIMPDISSSSLQSIKNQVAAYNAAFSEITELWPAIREDVCAKLSSAALNVSVYGRKTEGFIKAMDAFISSGSPFFPLFKDFEKFTIEKISSSLKKNQAVPDHAFFYHCQNVKALADCLMKEMDAYLHFLMAEMMRTIKDEMALRKAKNNIMFFDDLLLKVHSALQESGSEDFARMIRGRYKAALVDEFQDTDPVQFAIFQTVFGGGKGTVFFIGDPKQAIYSFRGADIFAYMKAASVVSGRYSIAENWRSEPSLVKAVNTLFSERENPFVFEDISFAPVKAASDKTYEFFTFEGRREAPLQWWFVPSEEYGKCGKPLSRDKATDIIISATAAEIVRLLKAAGQGNALIGQRPVEEADIAVLVRTNREARLVQEGLRRVGIPSVLHNTGNIFDTLEAEELQQLMLAVLEPKEEPVVRAALLTSMMGVTVPEMEGLMKDGRKWAQRIERMLLYHDLWFDKGFIVMFSAFISVESVRSRLIVFPDGERRLTNLLHLSEILEQARVEKKLSPYGLTRWLKKQMDPASYRLEEHQLRLERDDRAVRIVTIHKSKGLEYPIVFCPFTWAASEIDKEVFFFHDSQCGNRPTYSLGSSDDENYREMAEREFLAENVRLLYVALTRAKYRCYFVWGRFNKAATSAPAYLFLNLNKTNDKDNKPLIVSLKSIFKRLNDETMYRQIEKIAGKAKGEIDLREITLLPTETFPPRPGLTESLTFRELSGEINNFWRVASFSSITSGRQNSSELPDHDSDLGGEMYSRPQYSIPISPDGKSFQGKGDTRDIFSFPRGAEAGTLLHEILENFDFAEKSKDAIKMLISEKLHAHGFDSIWEDVILTLLQKVADMPLPAYNISGIADETFTLSAIAAEERINELEFYFPLRRLELEDLNEFFPPHNDGLFSAVGRHAMNLDRDFLIHFSKLHFTPVRGFMKGFIDMVFCYAGRYYLVDWKSNFLGGNITDYNRASLMRSMEDNFYILQYHIYLLALHQYLTLRLPGYLYSKHIGGVYYVFLRGIDPAYGPEYGIFRARPDESAILAMAEKLISAC